MSDSFELRPISLASIELALERAMRYRLLNDPEQAESICLDILEVDPDNQDALVTLILALTDQLGSAETPPSPHLMNDYVGRLADEYKRNYYGGIIRERQARAYLRKGMARSSAFEAFLEAMERFEKAATIRPDDNDEALMRWNACVRTIRRAHLQRRPIETELPLE